MIPFEQRIADAVRIQDPAARNREITSLYVGLSREMASVVGQSDANWLHFGAWASASAGTVIRGESLGGQWAAPDVLAGNTAIISDIGPRFSRFLQHHHLSRSPDELGALVAGDPLLNESAELTDAFECYAALAAPTGVADRRRAQLMLRANVQVAHHEQRFADPLIDEAIPGGSLLGTVASQAISFRLPDGEMRVTRDVPMPSYLCGQQWPDALDVLDDPALLTLASLFDQDPHSVRASNAPDWQDLDERMGFIFCLFRAYQRDPAIRGGPPEA